VSHEKPQGHEVFSTELINALSKAFFDRTLEMAQELGLPPFMHALALEHCARVAETSLMRMAANQAEVDSYAATKALVATLVKECAAVGGV
jgi:hypothetical protein